MKKTMIRLLVLALLCTSLPFCASAASIVTVSVGSAAAHSGDTVELPIEIEGNTGFSNLEIAVSYDNTALELVKVAGEPSVGATLTTAQLITENPYNLSWNSTDNNGYNGTLATLTFRVLKPGTHDVSLDYYKGRDGGYVDGVDVNYDESYDPLAIQYRNGCIRAEQCSVTVAEGSTCQSFSVLLSGEAPDGAVVAALYSANGRFKALTGFPAQSVIRGGFEAAAQNDRVKIIWCSDQMTPLCGAGEIG